jgi:hypothetical protein
MENENNDTSTEDAKRFLYLLKTIFRLNEAVFQRISKLNETSSLQDWNDTYSDENVGGLLHARRILQEMDLPIFDARRTVIQSKWAQCPKVGSIKKLRNSLDSLVETSCSAGTVYLKAYSAGKINKISKSGMLYFTSFMGNLIKNYGENLEKVYDDTRFQGQRGLLIFDNNDYQYSFRYPESWSILDVVSLSVNVCSYDLTLDPSTLKDLAVFNVGCKKNALDSPEEMVEAHLKGPLEFIRLSNPRTIKFRGFPACEVTYRLKSGTKDLVNILCVKREFDLINYFIISQQRGDRYKNELELVLDSFKFKE